MALQTNRPTFSVAQQALQASADAQASAFNQCKGVFEQQASLFPVSGVNQFGFTQAQMLTGLGADQAEFVNSYKSLLQTIALLMPSFVGDTWAAKPNIRPFFAQLGVTIPTGF